MSFVSWKHDKRWKRFKKKLSPWFETCWPNANPPLNDWTFCMWRGHSSGTERQKQFQWVYVFVFCLRFFVRRLRHFSKMSRTKLARLGKQCTGIHQYHLWSRTVVPKHSENHFGKICATFFNTVFGQPSFLGRKHIPRIHYLYAVWIVEIYCVCGRFFWSIVEVKEGMFIGTIFKTKNENHHEWNKMKKYEISGFGPDTALIRPWYGCFGTKSFFLQKSN